MPASELIESVPRELPMPSVRSGHQVPELYAALECALDVVESAIGRGDADGKSHALTAAMAIVFDLIASVDLERGGELAPRLAALYGFFSSELLFIARFDGRDQLNALRDMLSVLRGTWYDNGAMMS
jgi:flagellin-specific chaperone FliS